jgi:beta-lactamase class A
MTHRLPARNLALLLAVPVVGAALGVALLARSGRSPIEAQERVGTTQIFEAPVAENVPVPTQQQQQQAMLLAALTALDAGTSVDFSVSIVDHKSGATFSYAGSQAFETASVVKVDILAALLLQSRQDGHTLTGAEQDLAAAMIQESDNDAASALWDEIGDGGGLVQANRTFGLTNTDPDEDGYWGLTMTTANDQVHLLDAIANPSGPLGSANSTVLDLMGRVETDQDWGVSAAARTGESTILKNGWLSLDDDGGLWEVNSIGRITGGGTDLTIAVLSHGNDDLDDGIALVERVAQLTRSTLGY